MIVYLLILLILLIAGIKKSDSRESCLDRETTNAIKGIFILLVFFSHICPILSAAGANFSPVFDVPAISFIKSAGQLIVVMFLFYSGYGVMESVRSKGTAYIKSIPFKRVLSTLVNYDIAVVIFLLLNLILGIRYPVRQYLLSLIAWDSVGQSNWYIFAILCCYLSTYFAFTVFHKEHRALIAVSVLLIIYYLIMHGLKDTWWYNTILAYLVGMAVSMNKVRVFSVLDRHYALCLISIVGVFVLTYFFNDRTYIYLFMSVAFALLIFVLTYKITIRNKVLSWCGSNLFQLYVYQRIPMVALSSLWPDLPESHLYVFFVCCYVVTILFAFLIKPLSINVRNC